MTYFTQNVREEPMISDSVNSGRMTYFTQKYQGGTNDFLKSGRMTHLFHPKMPKSNQ